MKRNKYDELLRNILRDIEVEMKDEFDKNFDRQAFFTEPWQRRKSPINDAGRAILVNRGRLRGRRKVRRTRNGVSFDYNTPYAAIHNEGGEIKVTARMKRFFWAMHIKARGSFGRRKDGSLRQDKRNLKLMTAAEFWKFMALKPVGSLIRIPKRQFIGDHPVVETTVKDIIKENINEFLKGHFGDITEELKL